MEKFSQISETKEVKTDFSSLLEDMINSKLSIELNGEKSINEDVKIAGKEELKKEIEKLVEITMLKEAVRTFELIKINPTKFVNQNWINDSLKLLNENLEKLSK